jgi:hypothetical protein
MIHSWWIGYDSEPDLQSVAKLLSIHGWSRRWNDSNEVIHNLDAPRGSRAVTPDLVVVPRPSPFGVPYELLKRLRQAVPLTSIVCILGPWCGSIARRGQLWPGVMHVRCRDAVPWFAQQLQAAQLGRVPAWSFPALQPFAYGSTDGRRFRLPERNDTRSHDYAASSPHLVGLVTADPCKANWISEIVLRAGCETVRLTRESQFHGHGHCSQFVWTGSGHNERDLRSFLRITEDRPVISLVSPAQYHDSPTFPTNRCVATLCEPISVEQFTWLLHSSSRAEQL